MNTSETPSAVRSSVLFGVVVGECTLSYDPRSLSLDPCPTKMEWRSKTVSLLNCQTMLEECRKAAPTWTFSIEPLSPNHPLSHGGTNE